jgi:hypothetical protein
MPETLDASPPIRRHGPPLVRVGGRPVERPRRPANQHGRSHDAPEGASRTGAYSDGFKHMQIIRGALASLLEKLPEEMKDLPQVQILKGEAEHNVHNLIQLIYRARKYEGDSKDYEGALAGRIPRHRPHAPVPRSARAPAQPHRLVHLRH